MKKIFFKIFNVCLNEIIYLAISGVISEVSAAILSPLPGLLLTPSSPGWPTAGLWPIPPPSVFTLPMVGVMGMVRTGTGRVSADTVRVSALT